MKPWHRTFVAGLLAALVAVDASAALSINLPWVRSSSDRRSAQVYLRITSTEDARLVGVSSFAAQTVLMRAPGRPKALSDIALPAGTLVELEPKGTYIALDKLVRPLKLGEFVPITLTIESAGGMRSQIFINAEVRLRSVIEDEMTPHKH
jgi:copper(I)-binding protein